MKRTHDRCLFGRSGLALFVLLLPTVADAELTRVWAIDEGEKIKRTEIRSALETSPANRVWNTTPETVTLFGAKNEVLGFQIILVGGGSTTGNVDVRITDLTNGSSVIGGSPWSGEAGAGRPSATYDPFNYLNRDIELFTQQYVNIGTRTDTGGNGWFSSNLPDEYSGWVPDALIPFAAAQGRGGAPFSVPASTVQGVWADIYIPKHAAAGTFTGKILIYVGASLYRAIPISVSVRNFTLPDRPGARGIFGLWEPSTVAAAHGVTADTAGYYEIEAKYHQMAHRHKMDLHRARIENLGEMNAYHRRYLQEGAPLYTQSQGYYGPGEGVPNQTFSIGMYGELPDEYGGVSDSAGPYSCRHEKFGASYAWNEPEWRACPGSDGCAMTHAPSGTYNDGVMEKNASAVYPGENLMVFNFYGTGIRVRGVRRSDGGHANILVDGVLSTAVDFYRASDAAEEVYAITTLPLGWHQLKIRIPGSKDPRSSNTYVRVDRFDVISGGVTTPYDESFVKELIENCDPSNWAAGSHRWADWFASNAPSVKFWKYLHPDEYIFKPSPWAEDIIRAQATWTPRGENGRRRVPTFVTGPPLLDAASQQHVMGAVDAWGLAADRLFYHSQPLNRFHGTNPDLVSREQNAGNWVGFYNGYRPLSGSVVIDAPATDFRVHSWVLAKFGLDFYFLWSTTHAWASLNPFTTPLGGTYPEVWGTSWNGDGTFFYPGQYAPDTAHDRGLAGPLSSIRMKNWRRGAQDYEYLIAASPSARSSALAACLPAAAWDISNNGEGTRWSDRGYSFEECRLNLADAIAPAGAVGPPGGELTLRGNLPGRRCLDVSGWSTTPGTQVFLYDCNGGDNQKWRLNPSSREMEIYYSTDFGDGPGGRKRCLHAEPAMGAIIIDYCTGGSNPSMRWNLNANTTITNDRGKCLDVDGGTWGANGSLVWEYACHGGDNQTWVW